MYNEFVRLIESNLRGPLRAEPTRRTALYIVHYALYIYLRCYRRQQVGLGDDVDVVVLIAD